MTAAIAPDLPSTDTFGPSLVNFDPVVDPQTDLDAASWNLLCAQVTAISQAAVKAWVHVTVTAGVATLESHGAVWNEVGNLPTITRSSAGVYLVSWPTSVNDFQATPEAHLPTFKTVQATITTYLGTTATLVYDAYVAANARTAVLTTKTTAGVAADVTQFSLEVR